MKKCFFLDDERFPPNDGKNWIILRNLREVQAELDKGNFPDYVSFDHDLGEREPTGMDVARLLIEHHMDSPHLKFFEYYVHSQNPVGKENIEKYIEGYLDFIK